MSKNNTNWKLNIWDAIEAEDDKFEVTWITNDDKFQGRVTLSHADCRIFRQLLLDRCIDQKMWKEILDGNISKFKSHMIGNKTRAKKEEVINEEV